LYRTSLEALDREAAAAEKAARRTAELDAAARKTAESAQYVRQLEAAFSRVALQKGGRR
jgi:hypothetical protein